MKKSSIIGHFGFGLNCLDGQTVKTKTVTEEMERKFGSSEVEKFDTHGGKKTLFKLPFLVLKALKSSKNIIILPAQNGLKVITPTLLFLKKFFKGRKIHYVVIGGWLPEFLEKKKYLLCSLKKFDGIFVETVSMKSALEYYGFKNVAVVPNFKKIPVIDEKELVYTNKAPFSVCTFSRVSKEKGIENAVEAVINVNKSLGYQAFSLDIYGQIDDDQKNWFKKLKSSFPEYVSYGGLVPFEKSVEKIKNYFALLFPTYYEGEGFAGTLIDAFSAGVPVVASDWKYNSEIVNENVGFLFKSQNLKEFESILKSIAVNPEQINMKKKSCLREALKYIPENALKPLFDWLI